MLSHEWVLGHTMAGLRVYRKWDSPLFTRDDVYFRNTGHTLFLSIRAERADGSSIQWADIAAAEPGSKLYADMLRQAQQIKDFGAKVYIVFHHEPRTLAQFGTPAEYAAAWRKVVDVYRGAGVTNAEYVLTLRAYAFKRQDERSATAYYPGDAYVDHIAATGYNWYTCRQPDGHWAPLRDIIEGQRRFGLLHPDKGLMLLGWSSVEDPEQPGRKARWFTQAQELFKQPEYRQYRAVLQWSGRNLAEPAVCGFDYATSRSAQEAWAQMGNDPYYSATRLE